ncbi:MAG: radical SAM protein [Candidatus Micrarchaeia archaeon]
MDKAIPVIDIKLTNKCNYACEYCYAESNSTQDISEETFLLALNLAKSIGATHLEFCGGEPLMHPQINKIVKMARDAGFKLILRTNGILVNRYLDLISKNFDWVGISLDGTQEINHLMRASKSAISSTDKFALPIKAFFDLKQKNPKIKLLLGTMMSAINANNIAAFQKYLLNKKVPINLWKIYRFLPRRQRALENKDKFNLTDAEYETAYKQIDTMLVKNELGAQVIIDFGKVDKGTCLVLSPNGDLSLSSKKILNINEKEIPEIKEILMDLPEIGRISESKKKTYFE